MIIRQIGFFENNFACFLIDDLNFSRHICIQEKVIIRIKENIMKSLVFCCLIIIGSISNISAQSGRRIAYPIPGTVPSENKPTQTVTDDTPKTSDTPTTTTTKTDEKGGYSESAPNQPVSIYISRKNREKNKKDKDAKNQTTDTTAKTDTTATTDSDEEVLKVETTLIKIPVTVANRSGSYVPSLSKQNFQVFEDGKEQEIAYFGTSDQPFTAILLIDVSNSTSLKIEQIQDGAIAFVNQMLPQDKVMVISFDSGIHKLLEYSNDKAALTAAIRKIRFGGGTSLYDAVNFSIKKRIAQIQGKKAIVLFTDGVDTTSSASYESSVSEAVESEATIFPIYLNTFLDAIGIGGGGGGAMSTPPILGMPGTIGGQQSIGAAKEEYALGRRYLQDLANATGGRIFRTDNSSSGLTAAFEGIAEELRDQYEIGYYPSNEGKTGDRKQIRVRINRPNLIIHSRDSYIVK